MEAGNHNPWAFFGFWGEVQMSHLRAWRLRFAGLFDKERKDRELSEELESHLQMHIADNLRSGMDPAEARRQARIKLGGVEQTKERYRERRSFPRLESLLQDLRFGARLLRKSPGFTAVAVLTLALGIGANTAIFSLINTLMLRMLPVREPEQLVELLTRHPGEGHWNTFSWQSYEHFRDNNHVFSGLIATGQSPFSGGGSLYVRGEGLEPENVNGQYVTGNFFPVLGVKPALGRLIGPADNQMGSSANVAVVSWSYWNSRFQLDRAILGKQIMVEDVPVMVVGVTPPEFFGVQTGNREDIWLPVAIEPIMHPGPRYANTRYPWLKLLGRLKPGVSIEQARAEMAVLFQWTIEDESKKRNDPNLRLMKSEVEPAGAGLSRLRDLYAKPLVGLMALVGLLLIACTNVASMLLARGAARQREMAVRFSLGAGRLRLVRQVLTESLLLSVAGSLLGILLAYFCTGLLVRMMGSGRGFQRVDELQVRPDSAVLLFTAAVALLSGVLFGLAPAVHAMGSAPASSLRHAGRAGETRVRRLFGKSLVVTQVAFSVVLLSAASLFIRQLSDLRNLDLGFQRDRVLLVTLDPARSGYSGEQLSRAYRELLRRLEAIPGVRSATICAVSPIEGPGANRDATVEGYQAKPGERRFVMENWIAPKYFETFGTPLVAGRDFNSDDQGRSRVAIVNQTMVRYFFGDRNPIGRHVTFDGDDQAYEIVGVVGDAKYQEMREATMRTIYFNTFQFPGPASQFAIRTSIDPAAVAPEVRRTVRELLKTVTVVRVTTLAEQVDASIVPERLIATLSGLFGALGAVLAAIGIYGLLAYTVARRINEIGIRRALGATRGDVTGMVLRDALAMVCAGLAIGAPIAFWGKSFAASLLPGLPAESAIPIVFGAAAMIAIALLAAYVPARRAARVDPMAALRYE